VPQQLYGWDEFHATNFMRGYSVALNKLDDQDCLRTISQLGGDLFYYAKRVLKGIFENHGFRYDPSVSAIAETTLGGWRHSVVSLSDRFFDGAMGSSHTEIRRTFRMVKDWRASSCMS